MASIIDPGYIKPHFKFIDVLAKVHPCEMCPDCEVLRTPRSKHCAICNRCVERFDHHCPWINNCVGIHNHNSFLVFIVTLLAILVAIIMSSIVTLIDECEPKLDSGAECPLIELCIGCKDLWLRYVMLLITVLICLFFGAPAILLCYVHIKNYANGKTTNERFARQARSASATTNGTESERGDSFASLADLKEVAGEEARAQ